MNKRVLFKLGTFSFLCAGVMSLWILGFAGLTLNQVAASDQITTTTVTPSVATLDISYVDRTLAAMPGEKNAKLQEFSLKNNLNKTAYIKVTSFDVLNGDRTALLSTDPVGSQNLDAAYLYLGDTLLAKGDLGSTGKIGFNTVVSVEALKTSVLTLKGDVSAGTICKSLVFLINYESTITSGGITTTTPTSLLVPAGTPSIVTLTASAPSFTQTLIPNTATSVAKGTVGAQLISIKITNNGDEDLSFSPFGIALQGVDADADFNDYISNTAFYLDGVKLTGPVITDNSLAAFYNADASPVLATGKSMTFTVKGDIIGTISENELIFSTLAKNATGDVKMISAKGVTSSKVATMTSAEVKTILRLGATAETAAYFRFSYPPMTETFVIKLTDPVKIQQARDILSGKITDATHVMGTIIKAPADYNTPWSFNLDPASITFFGMATEVCDSSIQGVEDHLSEVGGSFLPNNRWCPWGSKLIEEVTAPDDDDETRYTLKINFGTGSGAYEAGETVAITANPTIATRTFSKWAGDTRYVKDPNSASTTVTMPVKHVTLTAVFKGKPCVTDVPATIKDGSMIRIRGGIDVYIVKIKNGKAFKRIILSPQVFKSYGHLRWRDIIEVDQSTLDSYITSNYVFVAGEGKIWKLDPLGDTGQKSDITESTEIDPDGVYEINAVDKESYR